MPTRGGYVADFHLELGVKFELGRGYEVVDGSPECDARLTEAGRRRPPPPVHARPGRPGPARAALHLRGASDLLAVHLDHWGHVRSPDATVLGDPGARDAALVRVAGQLDTVLAAEAPLELRCLQAGMSRTEATRWLPDLGPNRAFTRHLTARDRDVHAGGDLDTLRLIGEPARTYDPVLAGAQPGSTQTAVPPGSAERRACGIAISWGLA